MACKDKKFLEAVKDYIVYSKTEKINIVCFSIIKSFQEFISYQKNIDIILASPEMITDVRDERLIVWHDGKVSKEMEDKKLINKYISGDELICELLNIFSDINPNIQIRNKRDKKTVLTAFLSSAGGTGKTSTSISCAVHASKKGYKTLYLNFEEFQSTPLYFEYNQHSFSEAIFYIKQKYKNLKTKLEGIMNSQENLYYFSPVESANDFYSLTKEDIMTLSNVLVNECDFDLIVCDISSIFYTWIRELLLSCNSIVNIVNQNKICKTKLGIFNEEIKLLFGENNIQPKYIPVINRYVDNAYSTFDREENVIKIPNVFPFTIPNYESIVSKEYESAIGKLLSEVME